MGGIDFDPCSEARFNAVIKATTYYSLLERGEDGLKLPWAGRTLVNPPGGLIAKFWRKLLGEDAVSQAMWIGFSVEQLCILVGEAAHPLDFSTCILRKRLHFRHHADPDKERPSHGNYVCGVNVNPDRFEEEFGPLGKIIHGRLVRFP